MSTKNKKIVCFVDETGTAGEGNFSLGLVFVYAQETAKVDKVFSDLLPEGFNEFHANKHDDSFVRNILRDFAAGTAQTSLLMFNYHKHIHIYYPKVQGRIPDAPGSRRIVWKGRPTAMPFHFL